VLAKEKVESFDKLFLKYDYLDVQTEAQTGNSDKR
jgi:hypothetical protein